MELKLIAVNEEGLKQVQILKKLNQRGWKTGGQPPVVSMSGGGGLSPLLRDLKRSSELSFGLLTEGENAYALFLKMSELGQVLATADVVKLDPDLFEEVEEGLWRAK